MNTEDFITGLEAMMNGLVDCKFSEESLNPIIDNSDTGVKITIKKPGMHKDNTKIEIEDLQMKIKVDDVSTCINLSNKLNTKKIAASCEHGILVIDIPKKKVNVVMVEIN